MRGCVDSGEGAGREGKKLVLGVKCLPGVRGFGVVFPKQVINFGETSGGLFLTESFFCPRFPRKRREHRGGMEAPRLLYCAISKQVRTVRTTTALRWWFSRPL